MEFATVFAAIVAVAVASPQQGYVDDVRDAIAQLVNGEDPYMMAVSQGFANESQEILDDIDQLIAGVDISTKEVLAGGLYTIESLFDGTVDLDGYETNDVPGVVLADDGHLAGKPYQVNQVLLGYVQGVVADIANQGAGGLDDPFIHLLCYWNDWAYQEAEITNDALDVLNSLGLECNNAEAPPADTIVQTSSGTYMSLDSLTYLGCILEMNRVTPYTMFYEISSQVFDQQLGCSRFLQDTTTTTAK